MNIEKCISSCYTSEKVKYRTISCQRHRAGARLGHSDGRAEELEKLSGHGQGDRKVIVELDSIEPSSKMNGLKSPNVEIICLTKRESGRSRRMTGGFSSAQPRKVVISPLCPFGASNLRTLRNAKYTKLYDDRGIFMKDYG